MADIRTIVNHYRWVVPARVTRRKDADTFVIVAMVPGTIDIPMLDLHADMEFPQEYVLRLEGVDAFEKNTPQGREAIRHVDGWLAARPNLFLTTDRKKDSFGRTLGDLRESPDYVTGLAWEILQAGYAAPYTRHGAW